LFKVELVSARPPNKPDIATALRGNGMTPAVSDLITD